MQCKADPLSRKVLRCYAFEIRKQIGLEQTLKLPVLKLLESFPFLIGDEDFYYELVDDLPNGIHAQYRHGEKCILIKTAVYNGAVNNVGRDRMTIVHEMAHALLLQHSGIQLHRCFDNEVKLRAFDDPEWQAKCLAGELMIPANLVKGMSPQNVAHYCAVSIDAARYQLSKIK